jgi:hypothetical protein
MAINDIYQLTVAQKLHGQVLLTTAHFRVSTIGTGNAALQMATYFSSTHLPVWKAALTTAWSVTEVFTQKLFPLPPELPNMVNSGAGNGTITEASVPTTVAATITKRTVFAGQGFRGRVFITGFPLSYTANSELNATGLTAIQTIAATLFSVMNTGTANGSWIFQPILYHRASFTYHDIFNASARSPLRVQRRREVGRGV